ncbi:Unconventional Myosin-Ixb [Manis pentadactyla]|nr:Unconventional Myosin-Ixb [Manis pentadactyla]
MEVSRPSRLSVSNCTVGEQGDSLEEGCLSVPLQEKGVASEERIQALEAELEGLGNTTWIHRINPGRPGPSLNSAELESDVGKPRKMAEDDADSSQSKDSGNKQ